MYHGHCGKIDESRWQWVNLKTHLTGPQLWSIPIPRIIISDHIWEQSLEILKSPSLMESWTEQTSHITMLWSSVPWYALKQSNTCILCRQRIKSDHTERYYMNLDAFHLHHLAFLIPLTHICHWISSSHLFGANQTHIRQHVWTPQVVNWLVVSIPLKNISELGWWFPIYGKI